jgi:hypothetical protein
MGVMLGRYIIQHIQVYSCGIQHAECPAVSVECLILVHAATCRLVLYHYGARRSTNFVYSYKYY